MLITTFVFKSYFSSAQMFICLAAFNALSCSITFEMYISSGKRVNNTVWVVCVYKCGSNEVVSPVTALAALRGSLIYHSSAATSILFIASVEGLIYTGARVVLEIVSPEVRALSGLWQRQMGSVMGHSHHRRPPSLPLRDRLEKQGGRRALLPPLPQNCFGLGLRFDPQL